MSSLYNSEFISSISESKMIDYIEGKYSLDFTKLENRKDLVCLQHYLIKYIEKYGKTQNVNRVLKSFYTAFGNQPHMFLDSPLIRDGFINRFMPEEMKNKIKTFRDKYFDGSTIKQIYEKSQRYELSNQEKNRLYSFLILKIKTGNKNFDEINKNCIKRILASGKTVNELNDMELKFFCTYFGRQAWGKTENLPEIHIMKDEPDLGGFESSGAIYLNKDTSFTPTLEGMVQTVCHETQHRVQEVVSKEKESKVAFEWARHYLFSKYLSTNEFSIYHNNYNYSDIELDAEKSGFFNASVFLGMLDRRDLAEKLRTTRIERFDKRHYYEFMVNTKKQPIPPDSFVVEYLDSIIKTHPEELKSYKVLNNLYEPNGQRRSFSSIMMGRMTQGLDKRGIYDSYINYGIKNGELDSINLDKANMKTKQDFYRTLSDIFRDKAILFKEHCNDNEYDKLSRNGKRMYSDKQIEMTTSYQLSILDNIASYVDKNMDSILQTKEESKIHNSSYIYHFIVDFRDFELKNINNKVIENSPKLQQQFNEFKVKANSIINKFNKQYIKDRLDDMSLDQKKANIKTLDGKEMPLDDYLYYDILPKLDGHMEMNINGKKAYIGDIIAYYKKQLSATNEIGIEK